MRLQDLSPNTPAKEVVCALKVDGIVRIPDYLRDVDELRADVFSVINESGGDYEFGRNVKTGAWLKEPKRHPQIHKVFDSDWMREITDAYLGPNRYREGVFITHDFREDKGLGRNGFLHFDRTRAFKFFFYLSDCESLDCGPLMCFPGTQAKGKELRTATPKATKYANIPNRLEIDFPELGYKAEDALPAFGKAGTLLIFDSDVFHFGGRVGNGKERPVLRSHSRAK